MNKKIVADCTARTVAPIDLSAAEQAAYDAQQPIGLAQAQALSALLSLQARHRDALAAMRDGLTNSDQATTGDIAAVRTAVAALQAGTPPTQAQLLQLLRFVLRVLAIDRAI